LPALSFLAISTTSEHVDPTLLEAQGGGYLGLVGVLLLSFERGGDASKDNSQDCLFSFLEQVI
jgi:hypothetical protein